MKSKVTSQPKNLFLDVFDLEGKAVSKYNLDQQVFDGKINFTLMRQAVSAYLANQRKGSAQTKTKGKVRGGGVKPWRQKGTGRARAGSIRSPLWRGGGVVFGPQKRSYYHQLPKKMKGLALKSALNGKLRDQEIMVLTNLRVDSPKTKNISEILNKLNLENTKVRFVVEEIEDNFKLASRNIQGVSLAKASDIHTTEVLDCQRLVLTKEALREIEERLKQCRQ